MWFTGKKSINLYIYLYDLKLYEKDRESIFTTVTTIVKPGFKRFHKLERHWRERN